LRLVDGKKQHRRKNMRKLILALLLYLALNAQAQEPLASSFPNATRGEYAYLLDATTSLPAEFAHHLRQRLLGIAHNGQFEMAIAILPSIGVQEPRAFANELFAAWEIGQKDVDNGLLLLLVMDQRAWVLETGYALEATLTDATCAQIGENRIVPYMRAGMLDSALWHAVSEVEGVLAGHPVSPYPGYLTEEDTSLGWKQVVAGILLAGFGGLFLLGDAPRIGVYIVFFLGVLWFVGVFKALLKKRTGTRAEIWGRLNELKQVGVLLLMFSPALSVLAVLLYSWRLARIRKQKPTNLKPGQKAGRFTGKAAEAWLNLGQQVELRLGSVDYDVWVDTVTQEILEVAAFVKNNVDIKKCTACGYMTAQQQGVNVLKEATTVSDGVGELSVLCAHCQKAATVKIRLPRISESSDSSSGGGSSSSGGSSGSSGGGRSGGGGASGSW
jgi:uncharacterized protein